MKVLLTLECWLALSYVDLRWLYPVVLVFLHIQKVQTPASADLELLQKVRDDQFNLISSSPPRNHTVLLSKCQAQGIGKLEPSNQWLRYSC